MTVINRNIKDPNISSIHTRDLSSNMTNTQSSEIPLILFHADSGIQFTPFELSNMDRMALYHLESLKQQLLDFHSEKYPKDIITAIEIYVRNVKPVKAIVKHAR